MGHTHDAEKHEATALELTASRTPPSEKQQLVPVASRGQEVHEKVSRRTSPLPSDTDFVFR
jgi:hypothetical protein